MQPPPPAARSEQLVTSRTTPAPRRVNWSPLTSFLVALPLAMLLAFMAYLLSMGGSRAGLGKELSGLESSWSFSDSWVSNITAGSGLVVAILGSSDLLTSVLGEKAKSAIAVSTVAGVIALALIAAAGVLVLGLRKPEQSDVTVFGLLAGAVVALAAAGGQVWAVTLLFADVDLAIEVFGIGIGDWWIFVAAGLATALLVLYAMVSLAGFIQQGTRPEEPAPGPLEAWDSPEALAAAIVVASGGTLADREKVEAQLNVLKPTPKPTRAQDREPPTRQSDPSTRRQTTVASRRSLKHRSALL
jgi:uncharacterized membrane protein